MTGYSGYLADHTEEIVKRFGYGQSVQQIAEWLMRSGAVTSPWQASSTVQANVRHILRRVGALPPTERPTMEPRTDLDDSTPTLTWLQSENRKDWPTGIFTRVHYMLKLEVEDGQYATIGELRAASDNELSRIPNLGRVAIAALRQRIGCSQQPEPAAPQITQEGGHARLKAAVDHLVAVAAGMPGLPYMQLLEECFCFLINDCRIIRPKALQQGKSIDLEEAKAFAKKVDDLQYRIGQQLEAYEAAHGVKIDKKSNGPLERFDRSEKT